MAHVRQELALGTVGGLCRFLRLQQRFFRALVSGDVVKNSDAVVKNAFLISQWRGVDADPEPFGNARVADEDVGRFDGVPANRLHERELVGRVRRDGIGQVEAEASRPRLRRRLCKTAVQDALGGGIEEDEPPCLVGDDDAVAHAVENRLQDSRLLLERMLRSREFQAPLLRCRATLGHALLERRVQAFELLLRA